MTNEIENIARIMVQKPKGILAMDESNSTIGNRFKEVGLENTEENRRAYREMLITSQGLGNFISGAILFTETIYQKTKSGINFPDILNQQGILPGIKVDLGTRNYPNFSDEKVTEGLDKLGERLKEYKQQGAKFAKWRAVYSISEELPTKACINANAQRLAEYAGLCQENSIVPIVEPEVLMEGEHSLEDCYIVTKDVLRTVFDKLEENRINYKGMILKPNMVVHGKDCPKSYEDIEIAEKTVKVLKLTVPKGVPGIAFLSGGLNDESATKYLSEMNNHFADNLPWNLTFSFGRGLQREPLKVFAKTNNLKQVQAEVIRRAKETSLATEGKYEC